MKKIKKIPKSLAFILTLFLFSNIVQGQYVTIEGRQFKDGSGNNFYPMVCNYTFMMTYNPADTTYYISRINGYGPGYSTPVPNLDFECNNQASAYSELIADFTKVHDMGFNAIRTSGAAPFKKDINHTGVTGFIDTAFENTHPIWNQSKREIQYNSPYDTDSMVQNILFPSIELILEAADSCNLKVILDAGLGDIGGTDSDAQDYASYLSELADHFKNNTTLMAYVTIEEPEWSGQGGLNKEKVCEYTSMWYDSIRIADTNHLITIGGCGYWGAFYWDLPVMKMDFYSAHIYPYNIAYENYSIDTLFDRWKGALLWMHKNCPTPWIIGETGFSAIDDYYMPLYGDSNWVRKEAFPPEVNGSLDQQADFADSSLKAVRNLGGSGYSWWNYQENWWSPWEDGYGLLRHGALDTIDKPAVSVFENYPSPPPTPGTFIDPPNYYDPLSWEDKSPGYPKTLTGNITETGSGNPIEDAYIGAWTYYMKPPPDTTMYPAINYTFSQSDGSYSLNPNYPGSWESFYRFIGATASGAGQKWFDKDTLNPPWQFNIDLNYNPFKYDNVVYNQVVSASRNFQGWSTLTASDITIQNGASSEFKARDGVTINGEFTVNAGGEAYIYCTETFPECNDYQGMKIMNTGNTATNETPGRNIEADKQMEVNFIPKSEYAFLDVYPNPANGIFNLYLRTNKQDIGSMQVYVYDITGSCVYNETINNKQSTINLSFLSKGIYYLHASNNEDSFNQKLIIK